MEQCPFCASEVTEQTILYGGTCGSCFAHIPGEEAATDPGEDAKAAEAAVLRKRARNRGLIPLLIAVPVVLAVVIGAAWIALRPQPELATLDLDDGEFYMPDLDSLVVASVGDEPKTNAVEGADDAKPAKRSGTSDTGARMAAATKTETKVDVTTFRKPRLGQGAGDDSELLANLERGEATDAARGARGGTADIRLDGLDGSGLTGGLTSSGTSSGFQMEMGTVAQSGRPLSNPSEIARMVQGVLRKQLPRLRTCYERSLNGNPQFQGSWKLVFTIQTDGSVAKVKTLGQQGGDQIFEDCLQNRIAKWRFSRISKPQPVKKTVDFTR